MTTSFRLRRYHPSAVCNTDGCASAFRQPKAAFCFLYACILDNLDHHSIRLIQQVSEWGGIGWLALSVIENIRVQIEKQQTTPPGHAGYLPAFAH